MTMDEFRGRPLARHGDLIDKTVIGTVQITFGRYKVGANPEWFVSIMDFHGIRFNITGVFKDLEACRLHYHDIVNATRLEALPADIWTRPYGPQITKDTMAAALSSQASDNITIGSN